MKKWSLISNIEGCRSNQDKTRVIKQITWLQFKLSTKKLRLKIDISKHFSLSCSTSTCTILLYHLWVFHNLKKWSLLIDLKVVKVIRYQISQNKHTNQKINPTNIHFSVETLTIIRFSSNKHINSYEFEEMKFDIRF